MKTPGAGELQQLVLINDFSSPRGGATTLAVELALRAHADGLNVLFFTGDDGAAPALRAAGVEVVALGGRRLTADRAGVVSGLYNMAARRRLDALIRDADSARTVFHLHGWAQILSPAVFDALAGAAARTVVSCHDFFLSCPNGNYTNYPKLARCDLVPMSLNCVLRHCDKRNYAHKAWRVARHSVLRRTFGRKKQAFRYIAIHAGMLPILAKGGVPSERVSPLPNPVASPDGPRVEAEANSEVLYVGRLEYEKGADIAAAAAFKNDMTFRVVGDGRARSAVFEAHPGAIVEGWRLREELPRFLSRARVVVAPSRCLEPFGLAAVEALRAGVPVVASNSLLISADVERLDMGLTAEAANVDDFAAALARLRDDAGEVARMSRNAFARSAGIASSFDDWWRAHREIYEERLTA